MLITEIESSKNIPWEHGFGHLHSTAASRPFKSQHGTKNLDPDITHQNPLRSAFNAGLGFYAKPMQLIRLKNHGSNIRQSAPRDK
jgi:hypothetical protein